MERNQGKKRLYLADSLAWIGIGVALFYWMLEAIAHAYIFDRASPYSLLISTNIRDEYPPRGKKVI